MLVGSQYQSELRNRYFRRYLSFLAPVQVNEINAAAFIRLQ